MWDHLSHARVLKLEKLVSMYIYIYIYKPLTPVFLSFLGDYLFFPLPRTRLTCTHYQKSEKSLLHHVDTHVLWLERFYSWKQILLR